MELIGNLSRETVQMFKDQRKHNIQRTFVTGSDAANARVTKGMHLLKCQLSIFTIHIEVDGQEWVCVGLWG